MTLTTHEKEDVAVLSDTGLIGGREQFNRREQIVRLPVVAGTPIRKLRLSARVERDGLRQGHLKAELWRGNEWAEVIRIWDGDPRLPHPITVDGSPASTYSTDREAVDVWLGSLLLFVLDEARLVIGR